MKNLIIPFLIVTIISCNPRCHDQQTIQLYSQVSKLAQDGINNDYNLICFSYQEDPQKIQPYVRMAQVLKKYGEQFDDVVKEYETHPLHESVDLSKTMALYKTINDTALSFNNGNWEKDTSIVIPIYQFTGNVSSDNLILLAMNSTVKLNIGIAMRRISRNFNIINWTYRDEPQVQEVHNYGNTYSFNLNSISVQNTQKKIITINSVTYNDKLINYKPKIEEVSTFCKVTCDSLKSGKYNIKGTVILKQNESQTREYFFDHSFNIKNP